MAKAEKTTAEASTLDTEQDRYPEIRQALRRILESAEVGTGQVERLEVFFHASGDATYRYWAPRAEESEGGYIPPEDLS
jgi:hypothetical protein